MRKIIAAIAKENNTISTGGAEGSPPSQQPRRRKRAKLTREWLRKDENSIEGIKSTIKTKKGLIFIEQHFFHNTTEIQKTIITINEGDQSQRICFELPIIFFDVKKNLKKKTKFIDSLYNTINSGEGEIEVGQKLGSGSDGKVYEGIAGVSANQDGIAIKVGRFKGATTKSTKRMSEGLRKIKKKLKKIFNIKQYDKFDLFDPLQFKKLQRLSKRGASNKNS